MVMAASKPPNWVWPARVMGVVCLGMSVTLPLAFIYRKSVAAMPKEKVTSLRELRPTMLVLPTGKFQMGRAPDDVTLAEAFLLRGTQASLGTLPTGKFQMGRAPDDPDQLFDSELPRHEVEISQRFGLSETEVTQGQYQAVMGSNPSGFKDKEDSAQRPVENVSWLDAVAYCNRLSELEGLPKCYEVSGEQVKWPRGLDCEGYRLPTEAEWEYAARADEGTIYSGSNEPKEVAWFGEELQKGSTHAVKGLKANQWGLHDLSGNVYEWVWDEWGEYQAGAQKDPTGPLRDGSQRVGRGGSWSYDAWWGRVAFRDGGAPGYRNQYLGFRLARSYPQTL